MLAQKPRSASADRQVRAYQQASEYTVMPKSIEGNDWWVTHRSGRSYVVDLDKRTCTCPDHQKRRAACKHIALAQFTADAEAPQEEKIPAPAPQPDHAAQDARVARDRASLWAPESEWD